MSNFSIPAEMFYFGGIYAPEDGTKYSIPTSILRIQDDVAIDNSLLDGTQEMGSKRIYIFNDKAATFLKGKILLIDNESKNALQWFDTVEEAFNS